MIKANVNLWGQVSSEVELDGNVATFDFKIAYKEPVTIKARISGDGAQKLQGLTTGHYINTNGDLLLKNGSPFLYAKNVAALEVFDSAYPIKNTIILLGNVGRLDSKYTDDGGQYTNFSVAVNHGTGDKKETDWYNCTAWGKMAEFTYQHLEVGSRTLIYGNLHYEEWEKDGETRGGFKVTVNDFQQFT